MLFMHVPVGHVHFSCAWGNCSPKAGLRSTLTLVLPSNLFHQPPLLVPSGGLETYNCNRGRDLTFNMYVTFDQRAEHGSYPSIEARDFGHGGLRRCCLHLDC